MTGLPVTGGDAAFVIDYVEPLVGGTLALTGGTVVSQITIPLVGDTLPITGGAMSFTVVGVDNILYQDGTSKILLQSGTDKLLLQEGVKMVFVGHGRKPFSIERLKKILSKKKIEF